MNQRRWRKFFSYYQPHKRKFALVLLCSLLVAAIELAFPMFAQHIADTAFGGHGVDGALLAVMLVLSVAELGVSYYKDIHGHALGASMENDLRLELFEHLQKLSFSFYDRHPVGDLMSRLTGDLLDLSELYHHGPEDYIVNGVKCFAAFGILLGVNAKLAGLLLVFIVALGVWTWFTNIWVGKASAERQKKIGQINALAEDSLQGIRTVQAYGLEQQSVQRFADLAESFYQSRVAIYRAEGSAYQGSMLLCRWILIAAMFVGGLLVTEGQMASSGFVAFLLYIGFLTEPVRKLAWMSTQFHRGVAGFQRVTAILETKPEVQDQPGAFHLERVRGEIELENVCFAYGKDLSKVLENVHLHVKPRETVALVGTSGIGKTTLLSLIPRFYDVQQGCVKVDGHDVRSCTLASLRRNIAVVRQENTLFSGTVMENIRMGRPDASEQEIIEAAKLADADAFIRELPQGYHSDIGPHGVRLSGGQKQRICIARAFLKNAPVLLLDEATSALDNESEAAVQHSLERLCEGRTTIVVAHRLSTIRHADRICVLNETGICEEGTHDGLMTKNGAYAALYRKSMNESNG